MSHTYNEEITEEAEQLIRTKYYEILENLFQKLSEEIWVSVCWILTLILSVYHSQSWVKLKKLSYLALGLKGTCKQGSDVDIAICGEKVNFTTVSRLHAMLEDTSPIPYLFDVVDYTNLSHKNLKEHIDIFGVVFYNKELQTTN